MIRIRGTPMRAALTGCAFAIGITIQTAAVAESIDCRDSPLQVFPNGHCTRIDANPRWASRAGPAPRMASSDYQARGLHEGVTYHVLFHKIETPQQFVKATTTDEQARVIEAFDEITAKGEKWSAGERIGGALVRRFSSGQMHCFGFDQNGPTKLAGYASATLGYFCRGDGGPFDSSATAALIAQIKTR